MSDPSGQNGRQETTSRLKRVLDSVYHRPKEKMHFLGYWGAVIGIAGVLVGIFFLPPVYAWWHPATPPPPKKFRVLVPLDASSSEFLAFVQKEGDASGNATYDGRYSNRASQNIREIVNAAKSQWFADQISVQGQRVFDDKDVDFFFFPEGNSHGNQEITTIERDSFKTAFEQAMKEAEKAQREVVAVLGNVSSSSTLRYGEFCGEKGLPMILPLATATDITHSLKVRKVPAVLRLPPTNDKQAKVISDFLLDHDIHRTVIVKDISNDAYSRDLVEGFREHYVEGPLSSAGSRDTMKFGQILSVVPVAGPETAPFSYSAFSGGGNTALLIVGMTNSSIETLAQVNALHSNYKYIILTDGAVDEYLAAQIIGIQGIGRLSNLYLSFPSPCVMTKALKGYLSRDANLMVEDFEMSHALYVADGAYLTLSMLAHGLIENPSKPGREIITEAITKIKDEANQKEEKKLSANPQAKTEEPIGVLVECPLPFVEVRREYHVDKFGNNVNAHYDLFSIAVGKAGVNWIRETGGGDFSQCVKDEELPKSMPPRSR